VPCIDSAPAIAREAARRYAGSHTASPARALFTTGDAAQFSQLASALLHAPVHATHVDC
jgi:hypothetical protein